MKAEKTEKNGDKAVVVLSGGQDSTTALYWAKGLFGEIHCITFDYGQLHKVEIDAAKKVAELANVASHEIIVLGENTFKSTSPLVNKDEKVGHYASVSDLPGGVEPTFVPGRNALFLVLAANRAAAVGSRNIVTGICEADYGGYPDCRGDFLKRMCDTLSFALYGKSDELVLHTPLLEMTKKDSVILASKIEGCMEALSFSHTCYDGEYPPNPTNHASLLRARGFHEAGINDPLIVRAKKEGKLPDDYPGDGLVEGTSYDKHSPEEKAEKVSDGKKTKKKK